MCFDKQNGPMGPGAVVVSVEAREWCGNCQTMHHLAEYPTGLVMQADWDAYTCVVWWENGEESTLHFKEVDVLRWQTASTPPEQSLDYHDHD